MEISTSSIMLKKNVDIGMSSDKKRMSGSRDVKNCSSFE
jgi:hypothetical protein